VKRVLFVGGTSYNLPLSPSLLRKWDSLAKRLHVRVIARAGAPGAGDPRFRVVGGRLGLPLVFQLALPGILLREMRRFRPDVVIAQSPYEVIPALLAGLALRPRPKVIVEIHGDWRNASRTYGSRLRLAYAPFADRIAALAVRRADGTRAVSNTTAQIVHGLTGVTATRVFPTYFDLSSFTKLPPVPQPATPTIAWVGALQPVKNPEVFAEAWRIVAERVPEARLTMVGEGPMKPIVDALVRDFPGRVTALAGLTAPEVSAVIDGSTLLALPSQSEGLPRVIMETFARSRPVVASAVGGIPDIVREGDNGLLVPPGDAAALADELERVLTDPAFAERMGASGYADARALNWTPDRYADAVTELVEATAASSTSSISE
jgi:glycosyltransferase involved in cell wall biosynthesis